MRPEMASKPTITTYDPDTYSGPFSGTLAAIHAAAVTGPFAIGDALLTEASRDAKGNVPQAEWDRIAATLTSQGFDTEDAWKTETLRAYHRLAGFWPVADRVPGASATAHRRASSVGDLIKAKAVLAKVFAKRGSYPERLVKTEADRVLGRKPRTRAQSAAAAATVADDGSSMDPISAAIAALNGLDDKTLMGAEDKRLASLAKVLASKVKVLETVQSRKAKAVAREAAAAAKVGLAKASQGKAAAPKAETQPVGMRG